LENRWITGYDTALKVCNLLHSIVHLVICMRRTEKLLQKTIIQHDNACLHMVNLTMVTLG
jgi:hypothetical protein